LDAGKPVRWRILEGEEVADFVWMQAGKIRRAAVIRAMVVGGERRVRKLWLTASGRGWLESVGSAMAA
jgi:hypothetical protein